MEVKFTVNEFNRKTNPQRTCHTSFSQACILSLRWNIREWMMLETHEIAQLIGASNAKQPAF